MMIPYGLDNGPSGFVYNIQFECFHKSVIVYTDITVHTTNLNKLFTMLLKKKLEIESEFHFVASYQPEAFKNNKIVFF